jgi:hypothetical protein
MSTDLSSPLVNEPRPTIIVYEKEFLTRDAFSRQMFVLELVRSTRREFALTAILSGAIAIISSIEGTTYHGLWNWWSGVAGLWVITLLVAIGFAIVRKRQVASGMLAGIAFMLLVLGVTCFANILIRP